MRGAGIVRIEDHHRALRCHGTEHQQVKQTHAAGAEDHRQPALRRQLGTVDGAHDAGRRLHEHCGVVGDGIGDPARRVDACALAHQHLIGEPAGEQEVLAERRAHGLVAALAQRACAAWHVVGHRHPVAPGEPFDRLAGLHDLADELVAEHRARCRGVGRELEEVGAAQAHGAHREEQLAR